ncbi:condensation domain-containing protein [Micromonospora sp. CPCC 205546]|uniref:condensation domain-containing protein n=1 Tax=Micromonospora sp. CPCC 205546 TaxID=3122397 RepID=UPI002FF0D0C5
MNPHAQPIAIVGIAAALPGSGDDLSDFADVLDSRRDLVGPVPAQRRGDGGLDAETALSDCALLDRVDTFDHAFFGLSLREARQMDPQQRFLLQLSCKAIWDAGYPLADFRGSRTAVIFGAAAETYSALIDPADSPMVTGLLPAAQAGRIAHTLDLRGPAMTVDTACSSALAAIHEACRRLAAGEADWALTGGVRLLPIPPLANEPGTEGIVSPGGRARSFDAAADGTGLGEGGVVFLLKPLDRAQADGDPVHALILGGAANHDGARSNGFAAPSSQAQEELLLEAWRAAGVHPQSLGFIEAHGTGTRLGDPIEFQALSSAFARRTERVGFCDLSSVKSNLGHLDSAAGAVGLLKAVMAVKLGKRYASAHFTTPNPLLETQRSALRLSTGTEPWQTPAQRRAGVSAFGLTGTNVHLVVEQAPPTYPDRVPRERPPLLIPLAARSEGALRQHAGRLAQHLSRTSDPLALADLAWVQAVGRDHDRWRSTVLAADVTQAVRGLQELADGGGEVVEAPDATAQILLLPHDGTVDQETTEAWLTAFPALRTWHEQHRGVVADAEPASRAAAELLLCRLTLPQSLLAAGLSDRILIGHGDGNLLVDVLRGQSDLLAAAARLPELRDVPAPDPARTAAAFTTISAQGEPVFLAPWSGRLVELAANHHGTVVRLDASSTSPRDTLLTALAALYKAGVRIDWARTVELLGGYGGRRSIPTALFEPVRCWVDLPNLAAKAQPEPRTGAPAQATAVQRLAEDDGTASERRLAAIWCNLLDTERVSRDDDFFDLGGDSLMQAQMDNAIVKEFGVSVSLEDLWDHSQLRQLAEYVDSLVPAASPGAHSGPQHDPNRDRAPATHSQQRMWMLQQVNPKSGAYNVSCAFELRGPVDVDTLRQALDRLVQRHALLRTRFALADGELVQLVEPTGSLDLTVTATAASADGATLELREHASQPFDLARAGAVRALLLVDEDDPAHGWFQFVLHHAICDERSMNLLLDELTQDYTALLGGTRTEVEPPPLQFTDWAVYEAALARQPAFAEDAAFWRDHLAGVPTQLPMPTDFPYGPQQDHNGAWYTLAVPADVVARIREAARQRNGTLFTWMMTGYAAWLARLTQAEKFLVGVPVAGRHHADAERLPGCFINTLPVLVDATGDPSFGTLFERVRTALNGAFAHQRYPFDLLVDQLGVGGDASRPPLVQTLLSLQGSGGDDDRFLGRTRLTPVQFDGAVSWFDLSAVLWDSDDGGLAGIFAYRSALFEEATIAGFWRDWLALSEAGLTRPGESIHTLLEEDSW